MSTTPPLIAPKPFGIARPRAILFELRNSFLQVETVPLKIWVSRPFLPTSVRWKAVDSKSRVVVPRGAQLIDYIVGPERLFLGRSSQGLDSPFRLSREQSLVVDVGVPFVLHFVVQAGTSASGYIEGISIYRDFNDYEQNKEAVTP
jgi:hypothetical protein